MADSTSELDRATFTTHWQAAGKPSTRYSMERGAHLRNAVQALFCDGKDISGLHKPAMLLLNRGVSADEAIAELLRVANGETP